MATKNSGREAVATEKGRGSGMDSTIPGGIADGEGGDSSQWRAGDRIDRYQLIREIGSGAMGVVWSARDLDLRRVVAVKLIRSDGSPFSQLRARLLGEARAMACLSHPNVVAVYDVGTSDGGLFIAMERLDGGTLAGWLRSEQRPLSDVLEKFIAAGRGLAEAHRAGLVHRDFKPENVLLGRDGVARVADFGLAVLPGGLRESDHQGPSSGGGAVGGAGDHALTQNGDLVGTLAFMAPEQLLGDRTTARSDQFSFCVALYEAVCGHTPFGVPSGETDAAILLAAITEGRILLPPVDREVPRRLHDLLVRGLAYEPKDRWPSMDVVVAELEFCRTRLLDGSDLGDVVTDARDENGDSGAFASRKIPSGNASQDRMRSGQGASSRSRRASPPLKWQGARSPAWCVV